MPRGWPSSRPSAALSLPGPDAGFTGARPSAGPGRTHEGRPRWDAPQDRHARKLAALPAEDDLLESRTVRVDVAQRGLAVVHVVLRVLRQAPEVRTEDDHGRG